MYSHCHELDCLYCMHMHAYHVYAKEAAPNRNLLEQHKQLLQYLAIYRCNRTVNVTGVHCKSVPANQSTYKDVAAQ